MLEADLSQKVEHLNQGNSKAKSTAKQAARNVPVTTTVLFPGLIDPAVWDVARTENSGPKIGGKRKAGVQAGKPTGSKKNQVSAAYFKDQVYEMNEIFEQIYPDDM